MLLNHVGESVLTPCRNSLHYLHFSRLGAFKKRLETLTLTLSHWKTLIYGLIVEWDVCLEVLVSYTRQLSCLFLSKKNLNVDLHGGVIASPSFIQKVLHSNPHLAWHFFTLYKFHILLAQGVSGF